MTLGDAETGEIAETGASSSFGSSAMSPMVMVWLAFAAWSVSIIFVSLRGLFTDFSAESVVV